LTELDFDWVVVADAETDALAQPKKKARPAFGQPKRMAAPVTQVEMDEALVRSRIARASLFENAPASLGIRATMPGVQGLSCEQGVNEGKEVHVPMEVDGGSSDVSTMVPATGGGSSDVSTTVLATDTLPPIPCHLVRWDVAALGMTFNGSDSTSTSSSSEEEQTADSRSLNGKLSCSECSKECPKRSEFLLNPGGASGCDASWQGKMWGLCQVCSKLPAQRFKRQARRRWSLRAKALQERVQHVRCAELDTAGIIAKHLPGTVGHPAISHNMRCEAWAAAVRAEGLVLLKCRDRAAKQYFADVEKNVTNITIRFCCRSRNCLWFGLNHEWPHSNARFRCPCCAQLYSAIGCGKDRALVDCVLSMLDPVTSQQVHVPACWPDADHLYHWLPGAIEFYLDRLHTQAELQAYDLRAAEIELHRFLERVKSKTLAHFEEVPWDPNVCWKMPSDFDLSLYKRRGTTFGCKLDRVRDAETIEHPFTDWPLLIAMVGRVVAQARSVSGLL
jgi:hypothetical protein